MRTVIEKKPRTPTRTMAPTLGIHLPRRSEAIATPIEIQMKTILKVMLPTVKPDPISWMFALQASVAMNASEPPTQSGFVTQYSTEPMPAANRPQDIFIHSYGPPSWVKVVPSSAMRSAYGSTNATARMTTQANVWAPNPDT